MPRSDVQPASLAGTWYPADPSELRSMVERFLSREGVAPDPTARALVVPHAGYRYSGETAGAAYARVPRGRWRRAAVLAPSHYHAFPGAAVHPGSGFETPLGIVCVDREAAERLVGRGESGARFDAPPFGREHSIEIQLPFLQVVDPDLRLVPILVGAGDGALALGDGLRALDDGETLFVVSSDFTHYGARFDYVPFPPSDPDLVAERLRELDFGAVEAVRQGAADRFDEYVEESGITVCGRGPISAFLHARGEALSGELVAYQTSLALTGDHEHSVSYAAIVLRARERERAEA